MKKVLKSSLLLSLLYLLGCESIATNFTDKNIFYEQIADIKRLKPEILAIAEPMMTDIECVGDYLVLCTEHNKNLIYVYDSSGEFLGSYGTKGRASNEMISICFNGQKKESQSILYVVDINGMRNLEINISESISQNRFIIEKAVETLPYSLASYIKNDSVCLVEQIFNDNYKLQQLSGGDVIKSEELYTPNNDAFMLYRAFSSYSIHKDRVVWAMNNINQINILDLDSSCRKSISLYTRANVYNAIDPDTKQPYHRYYCDVCTTDKYIYALYMNQTNDDSYEVKKAMEIHVLDWDGNFEQKYIVDEYITMFTVSESHDCVYAKDVDGNIYRYLM